MFKIWDLFFNKKTLLGYGYYVTCSGNDNMDELIFNDRKKDKLPDIRFRYRKKISGKS